MRNSVSAAALALAFVFTTAGAQPALESNNQKFSYGLGLQIGQNLLRQELTGIDVDALALAIKDLIAGTAPRLSEDEMKAALEAYRTEVMAARASRGEESMTAGKTFLAGNMSAAGVTQLDSGLQYRVLTSTDGASPGAEDTVVVHYRGRLLNGTEFDSSYKRNEPAEFKVGQVIPGWQEALKLMSPGSKWEVWIPSELAYGERGAGGTIGPNEVLHFDIDLVEIKGK